ncbi:MAG: TetR/AcrR family transcriptional regulator, partial [Beijerinckiaceae bacterium]|nr:TetR/AcrR family transcriptional regulator [Beijerinckiaceae bacterium]
HGYNDLGIQALLVATRIPKGSFYHHFKDKEDFALQVIDAYMVQVHNGLDACLQDATKPPLLRIRTFFEMTQEAYREQGFMGCLMGGLGQEMSGVSEVFRHKIAECFSAIAFRMAGCLEEARQLGDIHKDCNLQEMADLLVDCWEGAALRSRLQKNPSSLDSMLDFYIGAVTTAGKHHGTIKADKANGSVD